MFNKTSLLSCILVLTSATGWTLAVQAAEEGTSTLEELIVTATRRSSDLQTTAVAATVLTGEMMEKKGIYDLTQLQFSSPGMSIGDYGSANTFNMRGIGRSQVDVEIPAGIQLYRDKVPMFAGYFQNEPYFDMGGVEVLRGPQGTLAGKSAAGGAIFFRTNDAVLGERSAFLEAGVGNFSQWEVTGMVNYPVSDTLAIRLAGTHYERDHWFDSITGDTNAISPNFTGDPDTRDLNAARLSVTWEPNAKFTGKLKLDVNHLNFGGNLTTNFGEDPLRPTPCCGTNYTYVDRAFRGIVDLAYEFDNGLVLTSVTGYQFSDTINNRSNNSDIGPFDNDPVGDAEISFLSKGNFSLWSQEVNLLSAEDQRLRWVTGIFYQRINSIIPSYPENGFNLTLSGLGAVYPFVYSPWNNFEDDISIFGNIAYDITDALEFEAGVRLSHYERDQHVEFAVSLDNGFTLPPLFSLGPDDKSVSEGAVDFKVGLNYQFNEDHFFYGFVARGHTVGGIGLGPPWLTFEPVEVMDYEGGIKSTWLDGRVQTQIGGYYQKLKDFQAVFASPNDILGSQIRNAQDKSTIYGIEVSVQGQFNDLSVDFVGAWNVTELGTFGNVSIPAELQQWFAPGQTTVDLSNRQSPYSPEITFNLGAEYAFHFGETTITPRIDVSFIDEQKDGLYDVAPLVLEERELVNVQVRFEHDQWYGRFYMENATDYTYIGGIQALGQLHYSGAPRMYGVIVGRHFDW